VGNKDSWDVLQEAESGSYLANDAPHGVPELAVLADDSGPLSGDGVVGTREAANAQIHDSTPRDAVEAGNIRKDRCVVKRSIGHARRQDFAGRKLPFDEADRSSAW
jgi:hypothetical protein